MKDNSDQLQVAVGIATFALSAIAVCLANRIGKRQNEINQRALAIQDYTEIFVMPQLVVEKSVEKPEDGRERFRGWNLLVKNASAYPIYLNKFTLNSVVYQIGSTAIPVSADNWYAIPLPKEVQEKGSLLLELEFEDYLGRRRYLSKQRGVFENGSWQIRSEKRVETGK